MPATKQHPYEYFSVAADVMALRKVKGRLEVLLIQRKHPPFRGLWALPGGFLERDEDAITAARREFEEEVGIKASKLVEFGSFSAPDRDPRGRCVTISFHTLVTARQKEKAGDDAGDARWFPVTRLPGLAFDHKQMIVQGLRHFRRTHER